MCKCEPKYYVTTPWHPEVEVTKEQYMDAENRAGFYSKFDDHPATSSFGCSKTGIRGRTSYCKCDKHG